MRIHPNSQSQSRQGFALLLVLVLIGACILVYATAASWTSTNMGLNARNNAYDSTVGAAEAATEMTLGYMARDFFNQSFNPTNLSAYANTIPTGGWAAGYQFDNGAGGVNATWISSSPMVVLTNVDSQFAGLYGLGYNCAVRGNAQPLNARYTLAAAVEQDFQLACIPVFQFAIFYSMDLEINPGAPMVVTGKVHSNGNIYSAPPASLEFAQCVEAAGGIFTNRAPYDPTGGSATTPIYDVPPLSGVGSMTLPVSTNNTPSVVQQITAPPPPLEDPQSPLGAARYYNQCDLIVNTTGTNVTVQAGYWDGFVPLAHDIGTTNGNSGYSFVQTNASFYDAREQKWTVTTDIDVGALANWMSGTNAGAALNQAASQSLGHQLSSLYINDQRALSGKLTVARVSDGQQLPPSGLTVATALPLYVKGNFNAPDTTPGLTNTANTHPASLVGDAITVLSGNWTDAYGSNALAARPAANTTVNAAFMAGIVQPTNTTGTLHYSGGVENFPRFLENWGGYTFTYNGSMVVMYPSQFATNYWVQTGTYYNAPTRDWSFDANFLNYNLLPPATPQVRKLVRGQWSAVAAR